MHYCTVLLYIALHACIPILHVVLQMPSYDNDSVFQPLPSPDPTL